ncbi:MAG: uracil-DNA glycosylase [Candidatus Pacebacteria bacterium]|nr:uracil-DNA glycosylase [Candidatus Paceibacterota bacterium]
MNKTEQMKQIKDEILNLKKSPLYTERIKNKVFPVIGAGDHNAKIMFVGEAPGKNEAQTGQPFCGASGRVLDELLSSINLKREDIYITNIVKDRPTANRDPSEEEIEIYGPFLDRQIEIIQPKIIATLGRYSAEYIMKKFNLDLEIETIGKMRGKSFEVKTSYGAIKIVPLLHPAVALYNSFSRDDLKKDFKILENK